MNAKPQRKIMLVDDNITNLAAGRNLLKDLYDVYPAPSAEMMFRMLEKIRPDLILLDVNMPDMDGYAAMNSLKATRRFADIPVIFLTARSDEASELKGLDLGAVDYVSKPFSPTRLLKRIENQFLILKQKEIIRDHVENLEGLVHKKSGEVLELHHSVISTLTELVEFRDRFTGGHILRTQRYLEALVDGLEKSALYWDEIASWDLEFFLRSAQLHDVGKIAIPDAVLNKPGKLTPEENAVMKTHVAIGLQAVRKMMRNSTESLFLRHAENIIGAHHEKWDGTGYPAGLRGAAIPLEGRLMALCDVYDALISRRPYKEAYPHEEARRIVQDSSGRHFDPALVQLFLGVEDRFRAIAESAVDAGPPQNEAAAGSRLSGSI